MQVRDSLTFLDRMRRVLTLKARTVARGGLDLASLRLVQAHLLPPSGPYPWLDNPDAEQRIRARLARGELSPEEATQCRKWARDGYIVVENAFAGDELDRTWAAYEAAIRSGAIVLQPERAAEHDPHPGRFLDPHRRVPELRALLHHPTLLRWAALLLGRAPMPFQTITSHKGSEQLAHSDAIHMTTHPLGFLAAAWIPFEDIHPDCGPLVYYPGSHRLPYLLSHDVGITAADFAARPYAGYQERYEPAVQALIRERGLAPARFTARKGDVLLWHANLLHGGSKRADLARSRRAVVCHYYARGVVCYHNLSGRLAGV